MELVPWSSEEKFGRDDRREIRGCQDLKGIEGSGVSYFLQDPLECDEVIHWGAESHLKFSEVFFSHFEKEIEVGRLVAHFREMEQVLRTPEVRRQTQEVTQVSPSISAEAQSFLTSKELSSIFDFAIKNVCHLVPGLQKLEVTLDSNMYSEDEWVNIASYVDATPEAVSNANDKLLDLWIDEVPKGFNDLIRFDYWFVD